MLLTVTVARKVTSALRLCGNAIETADVALLACDSR